MASEIRKIILDEYNNGSGPAYSVEYSTDCINYSQSFDCTNLFLPEVGSFGLCTVDVGSICIRLTSLNSFCTNSVIENIPASTSTTTTTSTTTSTTTTTTISPIPCNTAVYTVIQGGSQNIAFNSYTYTDVFGATQSGQLGTFQNILVGARTGSVSIGGINSTILYSSIDFCTQSFDCSSCNTLFVTNSSNPAAVNQDIALFFVKCGTNTLTSSIFDGTGDTDSPYPSSGSVCACTSVYQLISGSAAGNVTVGGSCGDLTTTTTTSTTTTLAPTTTTTSTTSTTTTLAPTTTTTSTTTTLAPTTTTTTLAPTYWNGTYCPGQELSGSTFLRDNTSLLTTGSVVRFNAGGDDYCATLTTKQNGPFFFGFTIIASGFVDCPSCTGATTTTTLAPTTTTTASPFFYYNAINCQTGASTNITSLISLTIGSVVKIDAFNACYEITSIGPAFGSFYDSVFVDCPTCVGTLPTTTTTAGPTTTTTAGPTTTTTSTTTTLAPTTTTSTTTTTAAPTTTTTTAAPTTTTTTAEPTTTTTTTLAPTTTTTTAEPTTTTTTAAPTTTTTTAGTTTTTTAGPTTTTTAAPSTTTTTEPCVDCYIYNFENITGSGVGIGGGDCNGPGTWSFTAEPSETGSTPCSKPISPEQIANLASQGLLLTSASCGNSCIPPVPCYTIETVQSAPGECFDCPGFFASTTDTIIEFFDRCSGSMIFPPFDINVEVLYSDNSTSSLFIASGSTGSLIIATSDVQCAPLPECGEIASPTFVSASVVPVSGSIGECCVPTTTTTTTESPFV
jgi:hypothetical protein